MHRVAHPHPQLPVLRLPYAVLLQKDLWVGAEAHLAREQLHPEHAKDGEDAEGDADRVHHRLDAAHQCAHQDPQPPRPRDDAEGAERAKDAEYPKYFEHSQVHVRVLEALCQAPVEEGGGDNHEVEPVPPVLDVLGKGEGNDLEDGLAEEHDVEEHVDVLEGLPLRRVVANLGPLDAEAHGGHEDARQDELVKVGVPRNVGAQHPHRVLLCENVQRLVPRRGRGRVLDIVARRLRGVVHGLCLCQLRVVDGRRAPLDLPGRRPLRARRILLLARHGHLGLLDKLLDHGQELLEIDGTGPVHVVLFDQVLQLLGPQIDLELLQSALELKLVDDARPVGIDRLKEGLDLGREVVLPQAPQLLEQPLLHLEQVLLQLHRLLLRKPLDQNGDEEVEEHPVAHDDDGVEV
mmetsp:Transcript_20449/g.49522  ORF Transcript_20449/g.49522 Transcript_20449/m.49522 type:complete len:405 (-) Transcript_20449:3038-4252(-)